MSKKNIRQSSQKLNTAKNLARGALAILRKEVDASPNGRSPIEYSSTWINRQTSTHRLNEAIETARSVLNETEQRQFKVWLSTIAPKLDNEAGRLGVPLAALGIFPSDLPSPALANELNASIRQLKGSMEALQDFARVAEMVSKALGSQDYSNVLDQLGEVVLKYGHSFWGIETKLAVLRLQDGVERLKKEVENLTTGSSGHQRFLYRYFGIRNEPSQNSSRFRVMLRKIIDDAELSEPLSIYLKFRTYGALENREYALASVLVLEQTTSTIDLFFTLQRVVRQILSQKGLFPYNIVDLAIQAETMLAAAVALLSEKDENELSDEIAIQAIESLFSSNESQLEHCEDQQAVKAVAARLSTSGDQFQSDETSKVLVNTSWLPVAQVVGEIHDIPAIPELLQSQITLFSPFVAKLKVTLMHVEIDRFQEPARSAVAILRRVEACREEGEIVDAISIISSEINNQSNENLIDTLQVLLAQILLDQGDIMGVIAVCATAGRKNERLATYLPLAELFVGKRWKTLRAFGPSVPLAIALSHATRTIDDSKLKTFKRYAVEELMVSMSAMSIDDLIPRLQASTPSDELAYLGYVVCDIPTMELLPGMSESREVRYKRAALLRNLAALPTLHSQDFNTEAQALEDALQVDDGMSILDDSKVHVDEQAVVDYVIEEYQADFLRYKKLMHDSQEVVESLPDLLKNLNEQAIRMFQTPKSDTDDLLVQLISNILHRFLYDPASGLDIIIGRRIRHNTISSELRGFLEKEELIGTIHHGKYQTPGRVLQACASMDSKKREVISAASVRFSDSIDQLITLLRDHYFNVRSKTKSRGVFELVINSVAYTWIKSAAKGCDNLADFTRECIHAFWLFLSGKLDVVRPNIESEIKRALKLAFQRFSTELTAQGADLALLSVVQRSSDELQRRATTIASWIAIPKVRLTAHTYTIDKIVDIATAVVLGESPGFKPLIKKEIDVCVELDQRNFVIVNDALYVALHNIAKHSGKKIGNNVSIKIACSETEISFNIANDIGASARKPEKLYRLETIRRDINRRIIADGARKNKHSGLYKLAALVSQEAERPLEFSFVGKDRFALNFILSYAKSNDTALA